MKNWLIGKYPDAGKDWGQEEKGDRISRYPWCEVLGVSWRWRLYKYPWCFSRIPFHFTLKSPVLYCLFQEVLRNRHRHSATWCKELTHWKMRCWDKIEGRRRRGNRGWDGWLASLTQWTWVGTNSGSWWWTRKPGVLQCMGSQRVGHDWATE